MLARVSRWAGAFIALVGLCAGISGAEPITAGPAVTVRLGDRPVALAGPWQFHLGDDKKWADPQFRDADWERLSANQTWARQGYFDYTGFAWYRLRVQFEAEGSQSPDLALLIPRIDDAYELYWNGVLIGRNGKFPPHPRWPEFSQPPQIFQLGRAREGVLAVRVWKAPPLSEDNGLRGGFEATPLVGTPFGISLFKTLADYEWLRSQQLSFALNSLYALIGMLMLIAWVRNRRQWELFWMAAFALTQVLSVVFYGLRLPWSMGVAGAIWQPFSAFRTVSLSFLLLWLLQLRENHTLLKLTSVCALVGVSADTVDGLAYFLVSTPGWTPWVQIGDALLTGVYLFLGILPLVLVVAAISRRERLNKTRWLVAICAFVSGMVQIAGFALPQGSRFTHWTFGEKIDDPLLILYGNEISIVTLTMTLLLPVSAFAVYRSFEENRRRQQGLQLEFESARALQQVLVPQDPPAVPGFRVTSAYRPALEVGGDFFQVIPLRDSDGNTLIVLGDVSGKGLRAAMAVSFIVGALHALVEHIVSPAALLDGLNERLLGRLESGFTTCLALRLGPDGRCVIAGAGHPPPFVAGHEVPINNGIPLGMLPNPDYEETEFTLEPGQTCMLYTDGLTEARNKDGELFGEERLAKLFAAFPTAQGAAQAAIQFGQDDDVTVVSITRIVEADEDLLFTSAGVTTAIEVGNPAPAETG
jgi:Stage II sporulation protein E (SpoIIE)